MSSTTEIPLAPLAPARPDRERVRSRTTARPDRWEHAKAQLGVAAGQGVAGVGNMLFSLVLARLVAPQAFAQVSTFLALYLAINLPANGLAALAALRPDGGVRLRRLSAWFGLGAGVAVAVASVPIAAALGLPVALVLCLALAVPVTPMLATSRGRLYGWHEHGGVVASLVAEPAIRLTIGLVLADLFGAGGGAVGVVTAGAAALGVACWFAQRRRRAYARALHARSFRSAERAEVGAEVTAPGAQVIAAGTFLAFGLVQNLDLLMANRLLGSAAPAYAALSTLGGVAAFATATIPLVLLPQAKNRESRALPIALAVAAVAGAAAVLAVGPDPAAVVRVLLGARYVGIAPLLALYLAAMGCFGIARVFATHNLAVGRRRLALGLVVLAMVGQGLAILVVPHHILDVAHTTMVTMAGLTVAEAAVALPGSGLLRRRGSGLLRGRRSGWAAPDAVPIDLAASHLSWTARCRRTLRTPVGKTIVATTLVGLVIRSYITRGIWLDEATSIFEARKSFGGMISQLYNYDVHPPLYFTLLWVEIRLVGDGQDAVRIISIIFGAAIVPVSYLVGRDLFDRRTGIVASILATVAPLMVWYSQEARMYSMFMLFALLAVWGQVMVLRRGRRRDWTIYVLSTIALGWTEYFGLFQVVVQQLILVAVLVRWRHQDRGGRLFRQWALTTLIVAVGFAPLAPFAYHQFIVNQDAGKGFGGPSQVGAQAIGSPSGVSIYSVIANVIWSVFGYQSAPTMADLGALWPVGILASLLVLGRRHRVETKLVVLCALGPLAIDVAMATAKPFLLDVRYVSGLAPLLTLLLARVLTGCTKRLGATVLACSLTVCLLTGALVDQQLNGSNPRRYDFQQALDRINREWRPGDELMYLPGSINQVIEYYSPKIDAQVLPTSRVEPPRHGTLFVLDSGALMSGYNLYQLRATLKQLRHTSHQIDVVKVPNVETWEFRR